MTPRLTTKAWPDALEAKPSHDWSLPLQDGWDIVRAGGGAKCAYCGMEYYEHPMETRVVDSMGCAFLNRSCDGRLLKL